MKILQVISSLDNGGAEKFVVELSNSLLRSHEVTLCSFRSGDASVSFQRLLSPACKLVTFNKTKGFELGIYFKLYRLIKAEKPEVIHFHLDATIKYILPFVLLFPEIRFVHTLHSDLNSQKQKVFGQFKRLKFIIRRVKLVCIAPNILDDFSKAFPGFQFHLVRNGIKRLTTTEKLDNVREEIGALKPDSATRILLSVGRLDQNKNQELLLKVMNDLNDKNVIALIIGADPSDGEVYLKKLCSVKPGNVFFLGPKTNVVDYLAQADALVVSSLHEGLPIAVLEAFSMGLPVLSTPAGGVRSLVEDTVNGFVARATGTEDMKKIVERFLELNEKSVQTIKTANKEAFLSVYHIDTCADNYQSLYLKS